MDDHELKRRISIALMDGLSIAKRDSYIRQGALVSEVSKLEGLPYDYGREASDFISYLGTEGVGLMWYGEVGFPCFDGMDKHCPYLLMYRGNRPCFDGGAISIVGTRHASWAALHKAFVLGMECAASGIACATGLAEGIDRAAADGMVSFCDRFTTNVPVIGAIGSGLATDYPKYTTSLKDRIVAQGGCIVTREAPHSVPRKYSFPLRNMVLAAVSRAVVVVQAPQRSGALITADFAMQAGKDVYVSSAGNDAAASSAGSAALAFDGAPVIDGIWDITGKRMADISVATWNEEGSVRYHDLCYKVEML